MQAKPNQQAAYDSHYLHLSLVSGAQLGLSRAEWLVEAGARETVCSVSQALDGEGDGLLFKTLLLGIIPYGM